MFSRALLLISFTIFNILVLTGCASLLSSPTKEIPLSKTQIEKLTHCKVSIKSAKKNLIISGYGIVSSDADSIVTEYKQIGYDTAPNWRLQILKKVSVVKVGENKVRIIARIKRVVTDTLKGSTDPDEAAHKYIKSELREHKATRKAVCG